MVCVGTGRCGTGRAGAGVASRTKQKPVVLEAEVALLKLGLKLSSQWLSGFRSSEATLVSASGCL